MFQRNLLLFFLRFGVHFLSFGHTVIFGRLYIEVTISIGIICSLY